MKNNNMGFTLVELMLAMSIFITVLLIATTGFIGVNHTFSKGLVRKDLSEGIQGMISSITKSVRNGGPLTKTLDKNQMCTSNECYTWPSQGGMYKVNISDIDDFDPSDPGNSTTVIDDRFYIQKLEVGSIGSLGLTKLRGIIRTKDPSDFNNPDEDSVSCKGSTTNGNNRNCALENFNFVVSNDEGSE